MGTYRKKYDEWSESAIWGDLQKDEMDALAFFYHKYYSFLFNYGLKMTRDEVLIEDTIQEIFYRFWNRRNKLSHVENPKSYIIRTFRNLLLDTIKGSSRQVQENAFNFMHETESIQDRIIEEEAMSEMHKRVDEALDNLPDRQREILYLKFYRDLDYQEISEILGINYQSVRNAVHTAVKSLRKTLISCVIIILNSLM